MARKTTAQVKRRLVLTVPITLAIILATTFTSVLELKKIRSYEKEKKALTLELEKLKEDAESLNLEINRLNSPEYIARYAREKFLYTKDEEKLIIQDYNINKEISTQSILEGIRKIDKKNLIVSEKIVKLLGYEVSSDILDTNVSPKGYRILSKVPKMPSSIIEKTVEAFGSLQHICSASIDELDDVEGIGEIRARIINQSLKRLQEQYILKSYNI